jgi:putative ABC transport system permease protein
MNLHYVKIALRNLSRQKILAFINVFGLAVGIACFSLFLLYALNEFSYDGFHKNGGNIFRVVDWSLGDKDNKPGGDASSYTPVGPAMKTDLPDIEDFARFSGGRDHFVLVDNRISSALLSFADPQFLKIFSFTLIEGSPGYALADPHNIILTRAKAIQLFGGTAVVGKRVDIRIDDQQDKFETFKVGGVVEDIPNNSSIRFEILGNFNYVLATTEGKESIGNWHRTIGINTFVLVRPGSHLINIQNQMALFRHKYYADEEAFMIKEGRWNGKSPYPFSFKLQPIRKMHTDVQVASRGSTTNPKNLWILIGIAAGILLIACINFTTLAIGRSAGRAREVGVRKVIGSGRRKLIYQFLTESILLSLVAGLFGLLLAEVLLPFFNRLCERQLSFSFGQFPQLAWILAGLIFLVGIVAGIYPALVLSGFRPVEVLRSRIKLGGSNLFTKSLVTFQFVISIGLIICTLIIFRQVRFLRSKNLGLNKENVIVVDAGGVDAKKIFPLFKNTLRSERQILAIAGAEMGLGEGQGQMGGGYHIGERSFGAIEYPVDNDFLKLMDMQLVAGRNFDPSFSEDSVYSIIINETMAGTELGQSAAAAVGQQIKARNNQPKTIIGVIKDFNFEPLNRLVRPQLFTMPADLVPKKFFVRLQPGDPSSSLALLGSAWKHIVPDYPFKYSFLDEDLNRFYRSEEKWNSILAWAGGISIFLACLGLFGLAALAASNRTKEIGIRKVMGASVPSIVNLLSKSFLRLVLIATLIASPVAWYFMNKWLQDYAYRIEIGWWIFVATGLVAIAIAAMTTGIQAIRAARANPVNSLRAE